ncbi:sigma-54-dependent transcriptional regulator [Hoeflea ulvae]|uniref:Sigma-54 dependent transcriptional regulator n=1 Tax=Hoeflea ulvae TaxID=2983764 RepID=A0ABT3YIL7_9HYPH|nr:sigma-54 dependent transcriptional regulator [Hoeflea ulvae]MCY0095667.1 sigma-54 dependent transcriptional regulator [Hoeflea ulvae]
MSARGHVLIIDDDADLLTAACDWLEVSGFMVTSVSDPRAALERISQSDPDVVISDIRMPGLDGMTLLPDILALRPGLPVVMMTGHGDIQLAVGAMRAGAEDFVEKPWDADYLVTVLDRAVEKRRMKREISRLQDLVASGADGSHGILGDSPAVRHLRDRVTTFAGIDIDVLVIGETGVGKELVARALHEGSPRRGAPFVAINCAAIPESLFESEVFGHAKGAFTGALAERKGKFEHAEGGTVFLDEIESMPLGFQAKLLRLLQERSVERLGDNRSRGIDVRVVTAAKSDLSGDIAAGGLRKDLYYRLAGGEIRIPPLRERQEDVALLFAHFSGIAARRHGRDERTITPAVVAQLLAHDWPGNVRELKAHAERFALGLEDARKPAAAAITGETLPERLAAYEISEIRTAMADCNGSCKLAAEKLGIPRRTLNEKLGRFGLR